MNKSAAVSSFVKSLRFADTLIDSSGNLSELQQTELNGETQHEVSPDIPDVNERLGRCLEELKQTTRTLLRSSFCQVAQEGLAELKSSAHHTKKLYFT